MNAARIFNVAGHRFGLILPDGADTDRILRPYLPFETDGSTEPLFILRAEKGGDGRGLGELVGCFNDEAPYMWIYDGKDPLTFGFSLTREKPDFMLMVSPDFRTGRIMLPSGASDSMLSFALGNSAMLMYMLCTATLDTLLIHASSVVLDGRGYAFTGRSGSGKSTHSRLWLDNFEGTELLNDDNPVIRVTGGKAVIFGSPWSGKTPCWKNACAPLQAVTHIFQAPENRIERLSGIQAYASFITSCSCMKWNRRIADGVNAGVEKLLSLCGFFNLHCRPDRDAALLCRRATAPSDLI